MHTQCTTIKYNGDRGFDIGDVLYKAEVVDSHSYNSTCRACKGEKILTVNGITFQCPCCEQEEAVVTINHYSVVEYFVTQIAETLQHKIDRDDTNQTIVQDNRIISIRLEGKCDDFFAPCENILFNKETGFKNGTDGWFNEKESAEKFVEALNCSELNKLTKYNEEHGTAFPVPNFTEKEG